MLFRISKKKIPAVLLPALIILFYFTSHASAEKWDDIVWGKYGISFSLPVSIEEVENTETSYIAESKTLRFELYPWKDDDADEESVALEALADLKIEEQEIVSSKKRKLNGFTGYEIFGEGTLRGQKLSFTVLGFINPDNPVNFVAYILYWHDGRTEAVNVDLEREIVESIRRE